MTNKVLIVVDAQNDFAHPDGNLSLNGADAALEKMNELIDSGEYDLVIYTKDSHPEKTTHFAEHGGQWPPHCVAGTWGEQLHEDLIVLEDSPIVPVHTVLKGTQPAEDGYSGFTVERDGRHERTELDQILRNHNIGEVEICGLAYDVCVMATALDACGLGYKTSVYTKATASVSEEGTRHANEALTTAGVTLY